MLLVLKGELLPNLISIAMRNTINQNTKGTAILSITYTTNSILNDLTKTSSIPAYVKPTASKNKQTKKDFVRLTAKLINKYPFAISKSWLL